MATDVNQNLSKHQPIFQMLNDDAYSSEDDGNEFYESKNSFESAQEHLINIFEPRGATNFTFNEKISNTSQTCFVSNSDAEPNDSVQPEVEDAPVMEVQMTLDEAIAELEAQKSQYSSRANSPPQEKEQFFVRDSPSMDDDDEDDDDNKEDQREEIFSSNGSYTSKKFQNSQLLASVHESQSNKSQEGSPNLIEVDSYENLSQLNLANNNPPTPELSADCDSVQDQEAEKDSSNSENEDDSDAAEEESTEGSLKIKNFTADEEVETPEESIFSHQISKRESIEIRDSTVIQQDITMESMKPKDTNTHTIRFKHVRLFYNKVIKKYHSAKTWVHVVFRRQPKFDQQLEKSKSVENISNVKLEACPKQRISHSVEDFSNYRASVKVIEEAPLPSPDVTTPIYHTQRKTDSVVESDSLFDTSDDISSAVFNIMQLCEQSFYGDKA